MTWHKRTLPAIQDSSSYSKSQDISNIAFYFFSSNSLKQTLQINKISITFIWYGTWGWYISTPFLSSCLPFKQVIIFQFSYNFYKTIVWFFFSVHKDQFIRSCSFLSPGTEYPLLLNGIGVHATNLEEQHSYYFPMAFNWELWDITKRKPADVYCFRLWEGLTALFSHLSIFQVGKGLPVKNKQHFSFIHTMWVFYLHHHSHPETSKVSEISSLWNWLQINSLVL